MTFHSILFLNPQDRISAESREAPACFVDLNLDQIVDAVTATKGEYNLRPFFLFPVNGHRCDRVSPRDRAEECRRTVLSSRRYP